MRFFRWLALAALVVSTNGAALEIIKSPNDQRLYEYVTLPNGLGVLLISSPDTDKAAAALDVNVGSGSNPPGREGLAHFLEHLLFLGTEKYPQPGEYKDFIAAHGGSNNAYTAFDHTNYFFNVDADHLEPALDRFAQFFTSPLFDEKYVQRERQVVHSEFSANLKNDGRRLFAARRHAMNPAHPRARFSVGNQETLGGDGIRAELIEFYERHYSAGLMKLVVLGKEPLPVLRRWVQERFSAIPNTGAKPLSNLPPLYRPGQLPARLFVEPLREIRRASFVFPMPPIAPHFRTKPTRLIADLLGHEGKGSLLSLLKARAWVEGLSAGPGLDSPEQATFSVDMQLTPLGLEHIDDIGELLFGSLKLIKEQGLQLWRYEELSKILALDFRFSQTRDPGPTARGLASALHDYPPQELLRAYSLMERFDRNKALEYLGYLRPDNVLLTVMAKNLPTDSKASFYETPYSVQKIDAATLNAWSAAKPAPGLTLPPANDFIPERLDLVQPPSRGPLPTLVDTPPGVRLWHATDTEFGLPHSAFFVSFRTALAYRSARDAVLLRLYLSMVNDELSEYTYAAELAGMSYSLYPHRRGFSLRLGGYSDREETLLQKLLESLAEPSLAPDRFAVIKAELARRYRNAAQRSSYEIATAKLAHLALLPHWNSAQRLAVIEDMDLADLHAFARELRADLNAVALAHGNLRQDKALRLATLVNATFPAVTLTRPEPSKPRVFRLPDGAAFVRTIATKHNDDAALLYVQTGEPSLADRAHSALLAQVIEPLFFETMRTERKLGYIVFAYSLDFRRVPGLAFVVQSPSTDAAGLSGHIGEFLDGSERLLEQIDGAEFARNREALKSSILRKEHQLLDRAERYWYSIDRKDFDFADRNRLASAVENITLDSFRQFWRGRLTGAKRRLVLVLAQGTVEPRPGEPAIWPPGAAAVTDEAAFRAEQVRFDQ